MSNPSVTIREADKENIDRVEALLAANGLPYQDVRAKSGDFFVAYSDTECIGTGGVEICGSNGLLRSVVITDSNRGQGYGTALCDALEDYARTNEVEKLYLLTTTAASFFRQRGYEKIVRENVPTSVQQTTEFTDLCPNTATCMGKNL
ncbi:arsenic resistance N-acetyltransferase ArsN2 [Haladaptatus halobius]|jgi:amino-acid N-acetyltransferase|uniref:arsenic resistance N-acetyltransferase ArsN2 n=1 Tax=Haladaptatus halobius TaxID=2884875 RepID=UPI001D09B3C9|nr:arsenic resistance N-acetyltransferase ArsN2 [Haladaptatus halobius]